MSPPPLHLASASPRRREILEGLGLAFSYAGEDVDETPAADERPDAYVRRLALAKARSAAATRPDRATLGADTAVVLDNRILGKPGSRDEALGMLAALSGRTHEVLTGVALVYRGRERAAVSASRVSFRDIGRDEAVAYWQSGEPRDKAGAYAIQGLGAVFVRELRGSHSGVVGLPVYETARLLATVDIEVLGT